MTDAAPNNKRPWTPDDVRLVRIMRSKGLQFAEIARALGRNTESVKCKMRNLQRVKAANDDAAPAPNEGKVWTDKEIRIARQMRQAGAMNAEIGERLGRSIPSVQAQFRKMTDKPAAEVLPRIVPPPREVWSRKCLNCGNVFQVTSPFLRLCETHRRAS